ncbi:hypothetical protein AVEN_198343-2-1, partial [Araneus ventricosus]
TGNYQFSNEIIDISHYLLRLEASRQGNRLPQAAGQGIPTSKPVVCYQESNQLSDPSLVIKSLQDQITNLILKFQTSVRGLWAVDHPTSGSLLLSSDASKVCWTDKHWATMCPSWSLSHLPGSRQGMLLLPLDLSICSADIFVNSFRNSLIRYL